MWSSLLHIKKVGEERGRGRGLGDGVRGAFAEKKMAGAGGRRAGCEGKKSYFWAGVYLKKGKRGGGGREEKWAGIGGWNPRVGGSEPPVLPHNKRRMIIIPAIYSFDKPFLCCLGNLLNRNPWTSNPIFWLYCWDESWGISIKLLYDCASHRYGVSNSTNHRIIEFHKSIIDLHNSTMEL